MKKNTCCTKKNPAGGEHSFPAHPTASLHEGRGLVVQSAGGRTGWFTRRFFPALSTRTYLFFIRLRRAGAIRRRVAAFLNGAEGARLSHIEIETVNRCNGGCAFCPVNKHADTRPRARMEEALFSRIMKQLADISYSGYLCLFSNNEPLLDSRLEAFAAEAREAVPGACLNLSTNGILLNVDLFRRLLRHFDRIVVNNYSDHAEMHDTVREVHDFCLTPEGRSLLEGKTVEISLRGENDILTSRGGNAPNRSAPRKPLSLACVLPFSQMVVRPDGKVSLCCNDALGQVTLGDLSVQSLDEVWNGDGYGRVRTAMAVHGRGVLPLCRDCDFVKHTVH